MSEFKLYPEDNRLTTFPIFRPELWKYYERAQRAYWVPAEVTLVRDLHDFDLLSDNEQHFIKYILAFFATSDGIVNINLADRFKNEVPILEAKYFYDYQIMMENIHAQMYSILIDTLIKDPKEKQDIFNASSNIDSIKQMAMYMYKCIDSDESLAKRLLRMACVEGIFFTGCFCAIYWLQNRGLMPGLAHSNELISRDEALHTMFALHLYTMLDPLELTDIKEIFDDATMIACGFINEALKCDLIEMNSRLMSDYICAQADNILGLIGCPKLYNKKNPFLFMEQINLQNYTNFFERRVSEYSKAKLTNNSDDFELLYDF